MVQPWAYIHERKRRTFTFVKGDYNSSSSQIPKPQFIPKKKTYYFGQKSLLIFFPNYKGSFYIGNKVYNCQKYLFLNRGSHNRIFPIIIRNPLSRISYIRKLSVTFQIDSKYNLRLFPTKNTNYFQIVLNAEHIRLKHDCVC